ncbi:MAG: DPP IV N-terminal domain-containing protein [Longimicrobiales bacterium]|nr:DPP IV N-terminal domain-containing protein [Longimicrobiales bacterium]
MYRARRVLTPPALLVLGGLVGCATAPAAEPPSIVQVAIHAPAAVTARDYRRAEVLLSADTLVHGQVFFSQWLEDGRYAYLTRDSAGQRLMVADPATGAVERVGPSSPGALAVVDELRERPDPAVVVSPDGRLAAFRRDHDLWVRRLDTGEEWPVTTDGEESYGYATNNAGWVRSDRPVLRWSPDSRRIFTFRHDARGVGMMYLTGTTVGHPELEAWRYPMPEDTVPFRIERLVADVSDPASPRVTFLDMPADAHRSSVCDHVYCAETFTDVDWADDGGSVMFLSTSRHHRDVTLRVADAETGDVRDVLERHEDTFFMSGLWGAGHNWRYLPETGEVVWYTHETDRGHLYLHDLATGGRERAITEGDWNVLTVERLDPGSRTIWFMGNGREPGDPYFRYLYRVDMDSGEITLLTPDSANHEISFSPDGRFVVDEYSTPTIPPVTVLRDAWSGDVVAELERADISRLTATAWRPPIPFTVKARDDTTDLYGLMFVPSTLDTTKQYPVVNYIYPGPQSGSVRGRSFSPVRRDHHALAELGFVVVSLDALGSSGERTKSFHDFYYGDLGDNGIPDQIAGIRELAARHGYLDLDRVGTWGHSGGGYASTRAILAYPDFYKVAVSQAGNHDNRNYEDDWGEWWHGLLVGYEGGGTSYDRQANHVLADQLKGKLLLAHGLMDGNVPPSNTLLVVRALIEADRDFDLIVFPDAAHGFAMHPFMVRNRWDYFVEHLLGADTPLEYTVGGERD